MPLGGVGVDGGRILTSNRVVASSQRRNSRWSGEVSSAAKSSAGLRSSRLWRGRLLMIPGDRSDQVRWQATHGCGDRDAQGVGVTGGKVRQSNQAGLALDECSDRRALVLADDALTISVPGLAEVGGSESPLMDRQHRLGEPRTAPARPLVRAATGPAPGTGSRCPYGSGWRASRPRRTSPRRTSV